MIPHIMLYVNSSCDRILRFIVENVETLISKNVLENSAELTSIIVILIQLMVKLFDPAKLKQYYKVFLKCLRKTSMRPEFTFTKFFQVFILH